MSEASTYATRVDYAFITVAAVCTLYAAIVFLLLLVFCIRYRKGSSADRTMHPGSSRPWEYTWTGLPILMSLGLFFVGANTYHGIRTPPPNCMEIHVVGKQWMWKIQHPEGPREINELHVPLNHPIRLTMTSEDVIHDFFVPAFRVKMDVLPGRVTTEWFQPTKIGRYHFFCSQYCGFDHARMVGDVIVMQPADYAAWLVRGASGPFPIQTPLATPTGTQPNVEATPTSTTTPGSGPSQSTPEPPPGTPSPETKP